MKLFFYIIGLFSFMIAYPQQQTIFKGKLLNTYNEPIEGASVHYINDTIVKANSDKNGIFEINYIPDGELSIYHEEYEPMEYSLKSSEFSVLKMDYLPEMETLVINANRATTQRYLDENKNSHTMNKGELLKAACCNLAESFETNPSIDVNFSDAISGSRQIKMLGLTSPYILITEENIPTVRGASQIYGLSFVPGTWVESIQVTKGAGSVVNGFESISGQINYEILKPSNDDPFFLNLYGSSAHRYEINAHYNEKLSKKWTTSLFLHGNVNPVKNDRNNDGFLDRPIGSQINVANRWQYSDNSWISFLSLRYMKDEKTTGEVDFSPEERFDFLKWGANISTEKIDASTKVGYVFPDMPYQSIGWQNSYNRHNQQSYFGKNDYSIQQNSFYSNLILNSIITNTKNKFATGISFAYDDYIEYLKNHNQGKNYDRQDYSIGSYFEYTYDNLDNLGVVAGIRMDFSNRLGFFLTPRMHVRYNPWKDGVLKASVGRGKRLANIFAENQTLLASNRKFEIIGGDNSQPYGLRPEIAWNYGLSFTQNFSLFERDSQLTIDFYRTDFQNQTVIDIDESAKRVLFYNLDGKSYANSFQIEWNFTLAKHLDINSAYKYYDIQTQYLKGRMQKPLQAQHRMFANLAYETAKSEKGGQWKFDLTWNWLGEQRLPYTGDLPTEDQLPDTAEAFSTYHAQITKVFNDRFEIYVGGENLSNYKQKRAIIGSSNPFNESFDATIVYSPIFGRMVYAGLRFRVK